MVVIVLKGSFVYPLGWDMRVGRWFGYQLEHCVDHGRVRCSSLQLAIHLPTLTSIINRSESVKSTFLGEMMFDIVPSRGCPHFEPSGSVQALSDRPPLNTGTTARAAPTKRLPRPFGFRPNTIRR